MLESGQEYCYNYGQNELDKLRKAKIKRIKKIIDLFNIESSELALSI